MPQFIDKFWGEYKFLSNFFIEADGTSVEVEYQKAKCANLIDQDLFIGLSPAQAKRKGKRVTLRSDWEEVKLDIMEGLLRIKFDYHKDLAQALLDTGDCQLIEGNNWKDFYWGVCDGKGQNHLGKLLMKIRHDLVVVRSH